MTVYFQFRSVPATQPGKLLGHFQPATTARYAHLDADPMRRGLDAIGATISAAMDKTRGDAVISLKKPA
jgi:hypothetical protein